MTENSFYAPPLFADGGMPLRRPPMEGEDGFFRDNPHVGGMRTEDGLVTLNPHSRLSERELEAVYRNEAARLAMQDGDMPPDMNPDQRDFLQTINRGSPYGPEREMRETTIARQLSGDPSGGIPTDAQRMYGASIRDKMRSPGYAKGGLAGYDTKLDPGQEDAYRAWAQGMGRDPAAEEQDYDLRGAYRDQLSPSENGHLGDAYKKPWHPTFSDQSVYHGVDGHQGGTWDTLDLQGEQNPFGKGVVDRFTPGATNDRYHTPEQQARYFREREPGVLLNRPHMADGGFMSAPEQEVTQEDGTVEPIPPGSLPEEVADDIDAKLSVGELVIPADVVRWFGVRTFEQMRAEAKEGFAQMEGDGRIQSPGGLMEPPEPETPEEDLAEPMEEPENPFAEPGDEPGFATGGMVGQPISAPYQDQFGRGIFTPPPTTAMPTPSPTPGAPEAPAPAPGTPAPVDAAAATPAPAPADTGSTWVAPAAVAAVAGAIGGAAASGGSTAQASPAPASGSSDSGGGFLDTAGNIAQNWGTKQAVGGLGSLVTSGGDAAGAASTGSLGGDLAGLGDAIGQGASDAWAGIGNWASGKFDAISGVMEQIGSGDISGLAGSINWSSLLSSAGYAAAGIAAGIAGNYIGSAIHGPSDQEDAKITVPVATAAGAIIGSIILPGIGTVIGTGIGAIVGQLSSGEPDIPYTFSGGSVVPTSTGHNAIAFTQGYAQNKGNPDTGTKVGGLIGNYVNLRAASDGYVVNPDATGLGVGAVGYQAGKGYFYAAPGHAPGEEDHAWTGGTMKELADVAYGDMVDRGILIRPGETGVIPGRTAQERSDLANAEHERSLFVEANGN